MTSPPTLPPEHDDLRSLGDGRGWLPCQQIDPETFFPAPPSLGKNESVELTRTAKWLCGGCPVRRQCLELALRNFEEHGVWGGKTVRERKEIRRARRMWGQDTSTVAS